MSDRDELFAEIERLLDDGYYPPAIWQDRAEPVIATLRARLESAEAALAALEDEFGSHRPEQVQTAIRLLRAAGVVRRDERSEE